MEKRKPTYDLDGFRQEFSSKRAARMTRSAQEATLRLGMTLDDVVDVSRACGGATSTSR
jgi:hypothetical protein